MCIFLKCSEVMEIIYWEVGFSTVTGYNRKEYIATAVAGEYMNHSLIKLSTFMIKIVVNIK